MHMWNAMGFLGAPLISKERVLPVECYRPKWLEFEWLRLFQYFTSTIGILLPIVGYDVIFMSTVKLTQIEFRKLNLLMKELFVESSSDGNNMNKPTNDMVKKCIEQHNFLLQ